MSPTALWALNDMATWMAQAQLALAVAEEAVRLAGLGAGVFLENPRSSIMTPLAAVAVA